MSSTVLSPLCSGFFPGGKKIRKKICVNLSDGMTIPTSRWTDKPTLRKTGFNRRACWEALKVHHRDTEHTENSVVTVDLNGLWASQSSPLRELCASVVIYFERFGGPLPHYAKGRTNIAMKLIVAYIQPDKLESVKDELLKADVGKVSVIANAMGCGQQKGHVTSYRGAVTKINLRPKTRLEIAVNDAFVQTTIDAIIKGARTGQIGDGKIFVLPMEECIRIRTGEKGGDAIG